VTPTEAEIRETARKAAEVLEVRGWCQDRYTYDDGYGGGPCCLIGALTVAAGRDADCEPVAMVAGVPYSDPVFGAVRSRLIVITQTGIISSWNDDPCRTADEVIAVLLRVAAGEGAS
jgi:hypothetical protein